VERHSLRALSGWNKARSIIEETKCYEILKSARRGELNGVEILTEFLLWLSLDGGDRGDQGD
jgi:hypothetical protein